MREIPEEDFQQCSEQWKTPEVRDRGSVKRIANVMYKLQTLQDKLRYFEYSHLIHISAIV